MINTQLLKFIKSINEDDYAMEVLYYCIRKTMTDHDYSLNGVKDILLSNKYLTEKVVININHRFKSQLEAFGILLSVRAIMLDKRIITCCEDDNLFFTSRHRSHFGWIEFSSTIVGCLKDEDFFSIYGMMKSLYSDDELSEEEKLEFDNYTIEPECRNLPNYYKSEASTKTGMTSEVICNNAFVCDDSMIEYNIPESVGYVGNTAFSYCPNLSVIRINNDHLLFGTFPIIECEHLNRIIVPNGSESYYRDALPYYKSIIFSEESLAEYNKSKAESRKTIKQENEPIRKQQIQHKSESEKEIGLSIPDTVLKKVKPEQFTINTVPPNVVNDDIPERGANTPEPINSKILKNVFDRKVTSYKYFWLMSIIKLAYERKTCTLSFDDLVIRMASLAWPLVFKDKFDFGSRDMMKKYLNDVKSKSSISQSTKLQTLEKYLKDNYKHRYVYRNLAPLLKNVPYRFLSPWIKYVSDEDVIIKSNRRDYNGLYAIYDNYIILDEDWYDYIIENYDDVHKFVKDSFTAYLKQYNSHQSLLKFMTENKFF